MPHVNLQPAHAHVDSLHGHVPNVSGSLVNHNGPYNVKTGYISPFSLANCTIFFELITCRLACAFGHNRLRIAQVALRGRSGANRNERSCLVKWKNRNNLE